MDVRVGLWRKLSAEELMLLNCDVGEDSWESLGRQGQQRMRWLDGWHHWLNGRESKWTPGVGDGQGGLACCDSWGRKELDTTERLNWTELWVDQRLRGTVILTFCHAQHPLHYVNSQTSIPLGEKSSWAPNWTLSFLAGVIFCSLESEWLMNGESRSVMSNSLSPPGLVHGILQARILE